MRSSLESPRPTWSSSLTPLRIARSRDVALPALRTTLFVGSVLNLINQWDALLGPKPVVLSKLIVTYCVPYCVSTYTATRLILRRQGATSPPSDAQGFFRT